MTEHCDYQLLNRQFDRIFINGFRTLRGLLFAAAPNLHVDLNLYPSYPKATEEQNSEG
jgi:hypothetical protein